MTPKLIFFVTEDWYFCSHRLPLAIAAKKAGYNVSVITRVRNHGEVIEEAGLRLIPFESNRRSLNLFSELAVVIRLIRLYREEKPDIVHHVAIKPVVYGAIAARIAGVARVVHALAGLGWLSAGSSRMSTMFGWLARISFSRILSSGRIITQNPDDRSWLLGLGVSPSNISLIRGSGVDTNAFKPKAEKEGLPVVMLVARMLWDKGVGEFVQAAEIIHSRGVKARFVLVGEPDEANPSAISRQQLEQWNRQGDIEWWGHREDMVDTLSQADIACLPSFYGEGVPKSLLEALSCGLPIVTTDMPGCREVVVDNRNGILVPPKDSQALSEALIQLIVDSKKREAMGYASRELAIADFSIEQVVSKTISLYDGLFS